MINLSLDVLGLIARSKSIRNNESKSEKDLIKALSEPKLRIRPQRTNQRRISRSRRNRRKRKTLMRTTITTILMIQTTSRVPRRRVRRMMMKKRTQKRRRLNRLERGL